MSYREVQHAKKLWLDAAYETALAKESGKYTQQELDKMYDRVGDLYDCYLEAVHEDNYPKGK